MNRSLDLDTIAPDDIVTSETQKSAPISDPAPISPLKKNTKKKISEKTCNSNNESKKINDILSSVHGDSYSFLVKPKSFKFQDCEDNEELLLVLRPHWFSNLKWIFMALVLSFVPSILALIFTTSSNIFGAEIFPGSYKFIATLFWYLFIFIFIFENFLSWYFDVYIVTDRRVVDIHFINLLNKKTSEANIEDIQDVTSRVAGMSQTLLNYGDVNIQTAAAVGGICFTKVPNPSRVTDVIQELREENKKQKEGDNS